MSIFFSKNQIKLHIKDMILNVCNICFCFLDVLLLNQLKTQSAMDTKNRSCYIPLQGYSPSTNPSHIPLVEQLDISLVITFYSRPLRSCTVLIDKSGKLQRLFGLGARQSRGMAAQESRLAAKTTTCRNTYCHNAHIALLQRTIPSSSGNAPRALRNSSPPKQYPPL